METTLLGRCIFTSDENAKVFKKIITRSSETPVRSEELDPKHQKMYKLTEDVDFAVEATCRGKTVECEWLLDYLEEAYELIKALSKLPEVTSYYVLGDDSEMPSFLITLSGSNLIESDTYASKAIDDWNVGKLFDELSSALR